MQNLANTITHTRTRTQNKLSLSHTHTYTPLLNGWFTCTDPHQPCTRLQNSIASVRRRHRRDRKHQPVESLVVEFNYYSQSLEDLAHF